MSDIIFKRLSSTCHEVFAGKVLLGRLTTLSKDYDWWALNNSYGLSFKNLGEFRRWIEVPTNREPGAGVLIDHKAG